MKDLGLANLDAIHWGRESDPGSKSICAVAISRIHEDLRPLVARGRKV